MTQGSNVALVAAAAGGYLLGRTKKGKLAIAVASWALGRKYGINPTALVSQLGRSLADSPQLNQLTEQVRGELMEAGRKAVTQAVDSQFDSLADSLHSRTQTLRGEVTESGGGEDSDAGDTGEDGGTSEDESEPAQQSSKTQAPGESASAGPKGSSGSKPNPKTDKRPAGKRSPAADHAGRER